MIEKGCTDERKFPDFHWREPPSGPMDDWFIQAYLWLCSERKYPRGPIPFTARVAYCERFGLSREASLMVSLVITHLDDAFWEHHDTRAERAQAAKADKK